MERILNLEPNKLPSKFSEDSPEASISAGFWKFAKDQVFTQIRTQDLPKKIPLVTEAADNILQTVLRDQRDYGNAILARDEEGHMVSFVKNLSQGLTHAFPNYPDSSPSDEEISLVGVSEKFATKVLAAINGPLDQSSLPEVLERLPLEARKRLASFMNDGESYCVSGDYDSVFKAIEELNSDPEFIITADRPEWLLLIMLTPHPLRELIHGIIVNKFYQSYIESELAPKHTIQTDTLKQIQRYIELSTFDRQFWHQVVEHKEKAIGTSEKMKVIQSERSALFDELQKKYKSDRSLKAMIDEFLMLDLKDHVSLCSQENPNNVRWVQTDPGDCFGVRCETGLRNLQREL